MKRLTTTVTILVEGTMIRFLHSKTPRTTAASQTGLQRRLRRLPVVAALLALVLAGLASTRPPYALAASCPTTESDLNNLVQGGSTVTLICSSPTTITFTSPITLNSGLSVTLDAGGSPAPITFDGGHTPGSTNGTQLFFIWSGAGLGLNGLTLQNGYMPTGAGSGGAIFDNGTLTVNGSTFSSNSADAAGAIYIDGGSLSVTNSTFSGNSAANGSGGAIYVSPSFGSGGSLTVTSSTFTGNTASNGAGAILNSAPGTINTISASTFSGNSATNGGGAIWNPYGTLSVTNSTFTENTAPDNYGGAISNGGGGLPANVSATASTFSGNTAAAGGGAIDNYGGTLTATSSTFSGNSAPNGAAIESDDNATTTTITTSTFAGNSPSGPGDGGAIFNAGGDALTVTNSTFAGNAEPDGYGGAIFNDAPATITASTFSGNSASDGGGAISNSVAGTLTVAASILATSPAGGNCYNDGGTVTDNGYNLTDDNGGNCGLSAAKHDLLKANPRLDALADNGGPTRTMALGFGSPAVDAIPTSAQVSGSPICQSTDQRDVTRPDDPGGTPEPNCDIGAYEQLEQQLVTCPTYAQIKSLLTIPPVIPNERYLLGCATGPDSIDFSASGAGTITPTQSVTLDASTSPYPITFDGKGTAQLLVLNGGSLGLDGLTLAHGSAPGNSGTGGAVSVSGGGLTVTNSTFSDNSAYKGGAISVSDTPTSAGSLTVTNSTFAANSATFGGAIDNFAISALTNSTFSGNTALVGGAIRNDSGKLIISGSIVANSPSGSNCYDPSPLADNGYNLSDDGSCGFTNGTNHDVVVGAGQAGLASQLASNGGPTQTIALLSGSPAIGAGNPAVCGPAGVTGDLDQRGYVRNADSRKACDIGAYDTAGAITIAKGWNLIGVPLQSFDTNTADGLLSSLDGQLGYNAVSVLATYANGRFALDVPNYTPDQPLGPAQGIFILSGKAGAWLPPGTAYTKGQPVSLQPGWNLVASPYPYPGLNGDGINGEIGGSGPSGCGLQEVATYSGGTYHVYTPGGGPAAAGFHVPVTAGMWFECTNAYAWTPN